MTTIEKLRDIQKFLDKFQKAVCARLDRMEDKIDRLLDATIERAALGFVFSVEVEAQTTEGVTQFHMTNSQTAVARIKPVGVGGRPALLDGVPVWASADETLATVIAAADGLSALITPVGPIPPPSDPADPSSKKTVRVTVTGDADLGTGVVPIFGTLDVEITPGNAIGIEVTLDPPTEQ
jgi:hypothetical protein